MGRFAAIDIGTVTCRLLVADCDGVTIEEVLRRCTIVNLGEGVDATGMLSSSAMKRTCDCIEGYLRDIEDARRADEPIGVVAIATSASRDARNAEEFVALLAQRGLRLTVIPGDTEAALSFSGASADFAGQNIVVADVGGGSTELIAGTAGSAPLMKHSFNVGCRRVTERFYADDPPSEGQLTQAYSWFAEQFANFFAELGKTGFSIDRLVAVAGTATSVVSVDQAMEVYDSSRVHGAYVSAQTLDTVASRLAALPTAQRRCVVGLQPDRAPVIVAGMSILSCLVQCAGTEGFTVSESDILQGVIMDAARGGALVNQSRE